VSPLVLSQRRRPDQVRTALVALVLAGAAVAGCAGGRDGSGSGAGADPLGRASSSPSAPTTEPGEVDPTPPDPTEAVTTAPTATRVTTTTTVAPTTTTVATTTGATPTPLPPAPVRPRDPVELAQILAATEDALSDPALPAASVPLHARQQQLLYGILVRTPEWRDAAFAAMAAEDAVRASLLVDAGAAARGSVGSPRTTVPAWSIRAPLPADELVGLYQSSEAATGVPWTVLAAVHFVETRMGRIAGTSTAGAQGPMQFMPSTWDRYGGGGDIDDDGDAIAAAAALLADRGAPDDLAGALHAYNPSDAYVAAVQAYHEAMQASPWLYRALHGWQVNISTSAGVVRLPEGYSAATEVRVEVFLDAHPDSLVDRA
jgi:hypothetical protein